MDIDIKTPGLYNTYLVTHSNSKYSIDLIIK